MDRYGANALYRELKQATAILRVAAAENRLALIMARLRLHLKAGFDPNQPRRRDGTAQSGWWTHKPANDPEAPTRIRVADIAQRLEALGGGAPYQRNTPKGATQFIFPNGMVLRFDLLPGQYIGSQVPHINIDLPTGPRIHINLK